MKFLLLFILLSTLLFYSCSKITYTPVVLAVYTLGTGTGCTGATTSGRYVADTALTVLNTVAITVNVTVAGPFLIRTNTTNGISFSNESTFTTTGTQTVILTGTGTPLATDTAEFTVTASTNMGDSCTFFITTVQGVAPHYYLTCFMNGMFKNFSDSVTATNSEIPGTSGAAGLDIRGLDTVTNSASKIEFGVSSAGIVGTGIYSDTTASTAYFNYLDTSGNTSSINNTGVPTFTVIVINVAAGYAQGTFSGTIKSQQGAGADSIIVTNGMFLVPVQ